MEGSKIDIEAAAKRLARAISFKTVSYSDYSRINEAYHTGFLDWLDEAYPLVKEKLARRRFGPWGVLYTWRGANTGLEPILLMAHYDVVPADRPGLWERDPFDGGVDKGFVWGRGALDVKNSLVSILEAAESLLSRGFVPRRDLLFAFGGDEEIGGARGAHDIGLYLEREGVRCEFAIDEGAAIVSDYVRFTDRPLALIGVAEKGFANLRLSVVGKSGHASMPMGRSAAGKLAGAINAIESRASRPRLSPILKLMLKASAKVARFPSSLAFSCPGLFWPIIHRYLSRTGYGSALSRTTVAVTTLRSGEKENVLPELAEATLNARMLPGTGSKELIDRLSRLVSPWGARIDIPYPEQVNEALPASSVTAAGYQAIVGAIGRLVPKALSLPFLVTVGTDTKHYLGIVRDIYRIMPVLLKPEDVARIHSENERISLENLGLEIAFYIDLLESC